MDTDIQHPERPFVVNPGRPIVRNTLRYVGHVGQVGLAPPNLDAVIPEVLKWVEDKHHEPLPAEAALGQEFEVDSHSTTIVVARTANAWALKIRQPDAPYRDRAPVPGRQWTTEIALRQEDPHLLFGCRATCSSQPYANPPVTFTRPRILVDLANRFGLIDVGQLVRGPTYLTTRDDLYQLRGLLQSRRRRQVVLVTEGPPAPSLFERPPHETLARCLSERLHCLAHPFAMPREREHEWMEIVGAEWAVDQDSIRTYQPGLNLESSDPSHHRLTRGPELSSWEWAGKTGPDAYARFLAEQCIQDSLVPSETAVALEFTSEMRLDKLSAESARAVNSSETDLVASLREQIQLLIADRDEFAGMAEQSQNDEMQLKRIVNSKEAEIRRLNLQVQGLQQMLMASGKADLSQPKRPIEYLQIAEWCKEAHTGRLRLHPRAERALKDAAYEPIDLVLDALELLANEFRNRQLALPDAHRRFEEKCASLGLEYDQSITEARGGEQGDTYDVLFPPGGTVKRRLEWHLRRETRAIRATASASTFSLNRGSRRWWSGGCLPTSTRGRRDPSGPTSHNLLRPQQVVRCSPTQSRQTSMP